MPTVVYPYPLACSPSSLQTIFSRTLHPNKDATLHNHSQKDGGRNDMCVLQIGGGGLRREHYILSLLSWRILDAPCSKAPRATFVRRLPPRPREWYFCLCHASQQELCCLSRASFCSVCCYCLVTATSPSVLVRLLHNSPSSADRAPNQQPLRQH